MVDLDDLEDIVDDPEDIVEDFIEFDDILETALSSPGTIIAAIIGVVSFGILLLGLLLTFLGLIVGLEIATVIIGIITALSFVAMLGAFGLLLHIHTSIPNDVQSMVQDARQRADSEPHGTESMSEEQAIEELKTQYAEGDLTQRELEQRIDDVFETDDPERVVERERY